MQTFLFTLWKEDKRHCLRSYQFRNTNLLENLLLLITSIPQCKATKSCIWQALYKICSKILNVGFQIFSYLHTSVETNKLKTHILKGGGKSYNWIHTTNTVIYFNWSKSLKYGSNGTNYIYIILSETNWMKSWLHANYFK